MDVALHVKPDPVPGIRSSIRAIDADSAAEIALVAQRMRQTLVEVEGEAVGTALYTLEWLTDRVRWHLDSSQCTGAVFVAVANGGRVLGHTIVRAESQRPGGRFGLFSTTYVEPAARGQGVASNLLIHGERWMVELGLCEAATWTSATNAKLIKLYGKHGYGVTDEHVHDVTGTRMVRLTRALHPERVAT
jgi:GNAT superfamily N-acetyltransferase